MGKVLAKITYFKLKIKNIYKNFYNSFNFIIFYSAFSVKCRYRMTKICFYADILQKCRHRVVKVGFYSAILQKCRHRNKL